jgi:hypothetical protein
MRTITTLLLGAAGALAVLWLTSAAAPQSGLGPTKLRQGNVVFGLSLVKPLDGLTAATPVTIRGRDGDWVLVDYPTMKSAPTWINLNQVVSLRTDR